MALLFMYIFSSDVDQSLYYFIDTTRLRLIVMDTLNNITAQRLRDMRPVPNNIVIIGYSSNVTTMLEKVK